MKSILYILISLVIITSCGEEVSPFTECEINATVIDMTGLDGCGFIFITPDGKKYEPVRNIGWCATGTMENGNRQINPDPLSDFSLYHGQKIKFSYNPIEIGSICMVGETIWVTCISEEDPVSLD